MTTLNIEETLSFRASTNEELDFNDFADRVGEGFNEFGVRQNTDEEDNVESVDVIFEAMEPGPPERRNGVRITEEFLRKVASKDYTDEPPHLLDHRKRDTFSKIGDVREVWFSDRLGKLMIMARVPNTGAATHDEAIARYTHTPPSIRDGSVSFGDSYEAIRNDSGEPELADATLQEFSATNFAGGYDDGGIRAEFAEAAVEEAENAEFDDPPEASNGENSATINTETVTF